jgi:hypothetical protein
MRQTEYERTISLQQHAHHRADSTVGATVCKAGKETLPLSWLLAKWLTWTHLPLVTRTVLIALLRLHHLCPLHLRYSRLVVRTTSVVTTACAYNASIHHWVALLLLRMLRRHSV